MSVPPTQHPPKAKWIDYDYAVVRVVPQVHLCTFQNVGVVLHARTESYLALRLHLNPASLAARYPTLDVELVERYLDAYQRIAESTSDAGPIGLLPPSERFHWLTTPRSAIVQTSDVHAGRTHDPQATLNALFETHVLR